MRVRAQERAARERALPRGDLVGTPCDRPLLSSAVPRGGSGSGVHRAGALRQHRGTLVPLPRRSVPTMSAAEARSRLRDTNARRKRRRVELSLLTGRGDLGVG